MEEAGQCALHLISILATSPLLISNSTQQKWPGPKQHPTCSETRLLWTSSCFLAQALQVLLLGTWCRTLDLSPKNYVGFVKRPKVCLKGRLGPHTFQALPAKSTARHCLPKRMASLTDDTPTTRAVELTHPHLVSLPMVPMPSWRWLQMLRSHSPVLVSSLCTSFMIYCDKCWMTVLHLDVLDTYKCVYQLVYNYSISNESVIIGWIIIFDP